MKLARYGSPGQEKPGLIDDEGRLRDLGGEIEDITPDSLTPEGLRALDGVDAQALPVVAGEPRYGVPWAPVGKIMCIGLNYVDHAKETGSPIPGEPILFLKANSSLNGPDDPVVMPKDSRKSDWEVELGVVIGTPANNVAEADALGHVAGYCVVNDVSEREWQLEHGPTWTKGKSCDTFCPIGPWLVTADEIADPQKLDMWLDVNGTRRQTGNTDTMIFGVAELIAYLSRIMTLHPGDVISTGTPPGVGAGFKPPVFLNAGDVMTLGIEGLGQQRQPVEAWRAG